MPLDTTAETSSLFGGSPTHFKQGNDNNDGNSFNLLSLPDELLLRILSYLDPSDHANTLLLNHRLLKLTIDPMHVHIRHAEAHAVLAKFRRPPATALAARNILYTASRLAPTSDPANTRLVLKLQRRLHSERLAHALRMRPSRTELVQRHIIVDMPTGGPGAPHTSRLVLKLERERVESTIEAWLSVWLDEKSPRRVVVPSSYSVACVPAYRRAGRTKNRSRSSSRQRQQQQQQQQQLTANSRINVYRRLFDNTSQNPSHSQKNNYYSSMTADDYFLKQPVSTLVHMFTCTAMWLSGPPPPRPPPLPFSGTLPSQCDWQMQMPTFKPPRKVVPQMCHVFEAPTWKASQSSSLISHCSHQQPLFASSNSISTKQAIQSQYLLDGRVKSLKQNFISQYC